MTVTDRPASADGGDIGKGAGQTIALVIRHALAGGYTEVEVTKEAADRWVELLRSAPRRPTVIGSPDCTPGYCNNEGQEPNPHTSLNLGYPEGAVAYFEYLERWHAEGTFTGLEFR